MIPGIAERTGPREGGEVRHAREEIEERRSGARSEARSSAFREQMDLPVRLWKPDSRTLTDKDNVCLVARAFFLAARGGRPAPQLSNDLSRRCFE